MTQFNYFNSNSLLIYFNLLSFKLVISVSHSLFHLSIHVRGSLHYFSVYIACTAVVAIIGATWGASRTDQRLISFLITFFHIKNINYILHYVFKHMQTEEISKNTEISILKMLFLRVFKVHSSEKQ